MLMGWMTEPEKGLVPSEAQRTDVRMCVGRPGPVGKDNLMV